VSVVEKERDRPERPVSRRIESDRLRTRHGDERPRVKRSETERRHSGSTKRKSDSGGGVMGSLFGGLKRIVK
jgi:hypothetical protein